jgi:hypothetical protein
MTAHQVPDQPEVCATLDFFFATIVDCGAPVRRTGEARRESLAEIAHKRRDEMRVLVIVKASEESEAGILPDPKLFEDMGKFNEELVKAGVMLAAEGLTPSSKGVRVKFTGKNASVIDGPFAETKELAAGFWLWKVKSLDDAVEWLKRSPFQDTEVEIRPLYEMEDFCGQLSKDVIEQEKRLRTESEKLAKGA